jgi:hypothetical protein
MQPGNRQSKSTPPHRADCPFNGSLRGHALINLPSYAFLAANCEAAMDGAKLGRALIGLGAAGFVVSVLWWAIFFARVNQALGGKASDFGQALRCLVSNSGPCGFITGIAGAAGEFAYQPALFWISGVVLLAGLIVAGSAGPPSSASSSASAPYDVNKWNALTELDPEIAAAVAEVKPYGSVAVTEFATKFLTLNDKQYLGAIVKQLAEKYSALQEGEKLDELGRKVELVWRTPWGAIAKMRDGTALVLRPDGAEILPSLEEFHRRNPAASVPGNRTVGWEEVTDVEDRRKFYREASSVLR